MEPRDSLTERIGDWVDSWLTHILVGIIAAILLGVALGAEWLMWVGTVLGGLFFAWMGFLVVMVILTASWSLLRHGSLRWREWDVIPEEEGDQ